MTLRDAGRLLFAVAFFVGAAVNAIMLLVSPELYQGFADLSFFCLYKSLWRRLIVPNLQVWIALVVAFEMGIGVLLLSADPFARLGLILSLAFALFLVPLWWGGGALVNLLLLVLLLWLLRFDYPVAIVPWRPGR